MEVTFANIPYGAILITKVDAQTNKPLANARFRVTDGSGAVAGNTNGEFITNENGEILIPNIKPGAYVVTEIEAPQYYAVDTTPQTVNVGIDGKTYTLDSKGELLITIMSSLAQEESRSISENVTWGHRKRMQDGKVCMTYKRFLGYRKGTDGTPEIVESEAEVVWQIVSKPAISQAILRLLPESNS